MLVIHTKLILKMVQEQQQQVVHSTPIVCVPPVQTIYDQVQVETNVQQI
jgi:hypothetical protein